MSPEVALLGVTALHAGFQAVVTLVVYPALRDLGADRWSAGHAAHSRRISVVVAPVYLFVLVACGWQLTDLAGASGGALVAIAGNGLALAVTAAVAAPTHGRLGRLGRDGPRPELLRRLLVADRVRLAGTLVALAGAVAAVA